MKKINKSLPPNPLTEFAKTNEAADWNEFYNTEYYKNIKQLAFQEQGELCAFCETKVFESHKQRLEHFHPKSDKDNSHNWALDWNNIIGVCFGGETDGKIFPLPQNLSCDAHKNHLINKGQLLEKCDGYLLNPLHIHDFPYLFDLDKCTGKLKPKDNYDGIVIQDNQYNSVTKLVEETINILNLNCDRLKSDRLEVLKFYNQEVKKIREKNDKEGLKKLAERWFQKRWLAYFTTRRILLGKNAENYLRLINYTG